MKKRIAIICGGPSAERGISLNSARSLYDNFDKSRYDITLIYFNPHLEPYKITPAQIYSNTPLDFDYKLKDSNLKLGQEELKSILKGIDVAFPAIHGLFGEDGQLQKMLEDWGINYVGSCPDTCYKTANKHLCQEVLRANNFFTIEDYVIKKGDPLPTLKPGNYVVKPLHGGSSLGVQYFSTIDELSDKLPHVFEHEDQAIIEPFFEGTEFTVIVLENASRVPVALFPTEIEFTSHSSFFDYRKKYLASAETRYHTPARFDDKTTENIREQAERAFKTLGMKDFTRLDGWISTNGDIWFSDINAISGMEQNSFLFQQAALFGLSHSQLLDYIINKKIEGKSAETDLREEIPIIFGGDTAERQVSVISGTNVWMKLKNSTKYKPVPLFLSRNKQIHQIPQFICLHHTVEEMEEKIGLFNKRGFIADLKAKQAIVFKGLGLEVSHADEQLFVPEETTFEKIAARYKFLFLGLHGGEGEDGTIQARLENLGIPYNGPGPASSRICMDKLKTGEIIDNAKIQGIRTPKKYLCKLSEDTDKIRSDLTTAGFDSSIILKPRGDGCSAGVVRVDNLEQFTKAIEFFKSEHKHIPDKAIHGDHGRIELPSTKLDELLVEEYIPSDKIILKNLKIEWQSVNDIIEVTVGVLGNRGDMRVFNPSQTIASNTILSLEEKFMGGTGINLTPPPPPFVAPEAIDIVKDHIKKVARILDIEGYSRIDTFMNIKTGDVVIIEANTLPGLSPSTVLFHQALAEPEPMTPKDLLEQIIEIGKKRFLKKD